MQDYKGTLKKKRRVEGRGGEGTKECDSGKSEMIFLKDTLIGLKKKFSQMLKMAQGKSICVHCNSY